MKLSSSPGSRQCQLFFEASDLSQLRNCSSACMESDSLHSIKPRCYAKSRFLTRPYRRIIGSSTVHSSSSSQASPHIIMVADPF